ncbi:MAG TPA: NUDIX domain-containing protein, partial [Longimicrobiales bacterium]|nr:NUDIX domain-containing protein [Longimicrobiales bacterium]
MGEVPPGARPAARVLVISDDLRLFLLKGVEAGVDPWWVSPGGGLRSGESFEAAAARELLEETGFSAPIGPCVWTRHHRYTWYGKPHDQYERFFVAWIGPTTEPRPLRADGYIVGHRWWRLDEIRASTDSFAPRRLGDLLAPILRRDYPEMPSMRGSSTQGLPDLPDTRVERLLGGA